MKVSQAGFLGSFLLLGAAAAQAGPVVGGTEYAAAGSSETVAVSFATPDGGDTTGTYQGLVAISVSGTGQSDGPAFNDAFYAFGGSNVGTTIYYQLSVGTSPLAGYTAAQNARNFVVYDLTANIPATPPYAPAYSIEHVYNFVLDTRTTTPSVLHFGVSDGNYGDNSGGFSVTVSQLVAVPEPASVVLLATGALLARRRRS